MRMGCEGVLRGELYQEAVRMGWRGLGQVEVAGVWLWVPGMAPHRTRRHWGCLRGLGDGQGAKGGMRWGGRGAGWLACVRCVVGLVVVCAVSVWGENTYNRARCHGMVFAALCSVV